MHTQFRSFIELQPIFLYLLVLVSFNLCVCECVRVWRGAQIYPSSMHVCVNVEETTLSHIVGVRRQAFCQPPLKCQTYSNCNKRKMHSNQIEAL